VPSLLLDSAVYNRQPFFSFTNPASRLVSRREWEGKEPLFYTTVLLLIFFALVRNTFRVTPPTFFRFFSAPPSSSGRLKSN
jgi:hypothetical protein